MKTIFKLFLGIIFLVFLQSCTSDSVTAPESGVNVGTLQLKITDAPFPIDIVAEANVTISQIEVRNKEESEDDAFEVVYEEEIKLNLMDLRNGVTEDIPDILLGIGTYDLVRLYVSDASVKLLNGEVFDLKIPSGAQSGIKVFIDPPIVITAGLSSDLLLDFDLSKSFVAQGNPSSPNGFIFTPVLRAVNLSTAGTLYGVVTNTASEILEGAEVKVIKDNEEYIAYCGPEGKYEIMGIPAGTYSVTAELDGYTANSVSDVEITAANRREQNFILDTKR